MLRDALDTLRRRELLRPRTGALRHVKLALMPPHHVMVCVNQRAFAPLASLVYAPVVKIVTLLNGLRNFFRGSAFNGVAVLSVVRKQPGRFSGQVRLFRFRRVGGLRIARSLHRHWKSTD